MRNPAQPHCIQTEISAIVQIAMATQKANLVASDRCQQFAPLASRHVDRGEDQMVSVAPRHPRAESRRE
jgi:hypothetical protein